MPPQHGKALDIHTPIATPQGWTTIGALSKGDKVFSDTGQICTVTAVSEVWKKRPVYRVKTDDGDSIIADAAHDWVVRLCRKRPVLSVKSTEWLAKRSSIRAPMVLSQGALNLPETSLEIHPYMLGLWLGDGCSDHATITAHDDDAAYIRPKLHALGYQTTDRKTRQTFGVLKLKVLLRSEGVLNNKHVPLKYLRGSISQRLDLLRGLMDSDGHVAPDGQCEFCSTNKQLALDVQQLVHSLGYKASLITGEARLNGRYISDKWRVMFYMPNAASLPRKAIRCREPKKKGRYLTFEPAGVADTVCIEVDSPSHMFLCGRSMLPTHNSELTTRNFPAYLEGKNPNRRIAVVSYNDTMSNGFNRAMQRAIDNASYLEIFPETKLNNSDHHNVRQQDKVRNTDRIDIVNAVGSIMTIGVGGSLTGNPVDIGIIDDPYKDREQARSESYKRYIREWYSDVFRTRLHNGSQELIIMTSWDEDDLCQWLLRKESDWHVVKFPAIREANESSYDPREVGEALWPEKHSAEKILAVKATSQVTFNALYQQDPKPNTDILIFGNWQECEELPEDDKVFWGCDFGYTNDPTAIVKTVRQGDKIYLKECCYQPCGDEHGIKAILVANGYKSGQPVYCDHDKELAAALRRVGVTAIFAQKSIGAGIAKVNTFQVFFTEDSPNIRTERSKYQYVTYGEVITNIPAQGWDHLMDAARYSIYTHYFRA